MENEHVSGAQSGLTPPSHRDESSVSSQVPFLVTQWIANYSNSSQDGETKEEKEGKDAALRRIRNAASELAAAFSTLGAYGPAIRSPLGHLGSGNRFACAQQPLRNATFTDVDRRWSTVASNHLESLIASSASSSDVVQREALNRATPASYMDAAYEGVAQSGSSRPGGGGRRVGEQELIDNGDNTALLHQSVLQSQALIAPNEANYNVKSLSETTLYSLKVDEQIDRIFSGVDLSKPLPERQLTATLGSDHGRIAVLASKASRRHLMMRAKLQDIESNMTDLKRSIAAQEQVQIEITIQRSAQMGLLASLDDTIDAPPTKNIGGKPSSPAKFTRSEHKIKMDEIDGRQLDVLRVIPQLQLKLKDLLAAHSKVQTDLNIAAIISKFLFRQSNSVRAKYCDPFEGNQGSSLPVSFLTCTVKGGTVLSRLIAKNHCGGGSWRQSIPTRRPFGMTPSSNTISLNRKAILAKRMSHAITINCHLSYPIYCIAFDKSGRYFMTGADDHLVRLFHLGSTISSVSRGSGRPKCNMLGNGRGAVLVCTLRGHAGVINDISVSTDNSMLATASDDGDVRVWGLLNGSPIAILRGHTGGANMISWSDLTPFRLVSTGSDGLARMWDVREAALKRYGGIIGTRSDYILPQVDNMENEDEDSSDEEDGDDIIHIPGAEGSEPILPPLPVRLSLEEGIAVAGSSSAGAVPPLILDNSSSSADASGNMVLGPIPNIVAGPMALAGNGPGVRQAGIAAGPGDSIRVNGVGNGAVNNHGSAPGAFVASDTVDEGVRLLSKLQHGELIEQNEHQGAGTRSRRKKVKVICITRCPVGGHFATGSDDGVGRIWADDDDLELALIDKTMREHNAIGNGASMVSAKRLKCPRKGSRRSGRLHPEMGNHAAVAPSKSTLLLTLCGHLNAITDLRYSSTGDRILTGSHKDGMVRIWAWGKEKVIKKDAPPHHPSAQPAFENLTQILFHLKAPPQCRKASSTTSNTTSTRRRGGSGSSSSSNDLPVSCDGAVWTSDDSKIVTSQSCLVTATGTKIIDGSQFIHIWDSHTGRCLMGIASAHTAVCPVLISHPLEPSLLTSAGADGYVHCWDLNSGRCFFSHKNMVLYGHVDPPTDLGKQSGYLDGAYSPDGLNLVLTDDAGRITLIDTLESEETCKSSKLTGQNMERGTAATPVIDNNADMGVQCPFWMREQYFANDYYELFYDQNGYCIERGSERPPHLAPRGARCTNTGSPYSDSVNDAYCRMGGPQPLLQEECRWKRDSIRSLSVQVRCDGGLLARNVYGKRNLTLSQSGIDPSEPSSTTIVRHKGPAHLHLDTISVSQGAAEQSSSRAPQWPRDTVNSRTTTGRSLSNNYRWSDYDDILREEEANGDDLVDADDEDYEERGGRNVDDDQLNEVGDDENTDESTDESEDDRHSPHSASRSQRRPRAGQRLGGRHGGQGNTRRVSSGSRSRRSISRNRTREQLSTFEEATRNQPTRVSSRQVAGNRRLEDYTIPGSSDDEDIVEQISTNNTPSGEFVDDYNIAGHYFKMPTGPLQRKWLTRVESKSGYLGEKTYCPQVGDSVIYIPRAHYETIKSFPTGGNSSAPWKSFPSNSPWPVVRCKVMSIRYRFPFSRYYKPRSKKFCSVVAIVTLALTGIPEHSHDRQFPWPKPKFIARNTRSCDISFEVSIFDSDEVEFLLPEHLYLWRINCLENVIREQNFGANGIKLTAFFEDEPPEEDRKRTPSTGEVKGFEAIPLEESDFHFQASGFDAFQVEWEDGTLNSLSSWEVNVEKSRDIVPQPTCMFDDEKSVVMKAIETISNESIVKMWFNNPVDTRAYSDYLDRIEVPMDMSFIRKRVNNNYYSNKLSVLADVQLIRDNSVKFNTATSEISEGAEEVFERFKELINHVGVDSIDVHRDNRIERHTRSQATNVEQRSSAFMAQMRSSNRTSRRINAVTERHDTRAQDGIGVSSLENLPVPNVSGGSPGHSEDERSPSQDERQSPSESEELDYGDESQSCGSSDGDAPNTAPKKSSTRIQVSTGTTTGRSRRSATKKISYEEADGSDAPEATDHESEEESVRSPPRAHTKKRARYSPQRAGADHLASNMSDSDGQDSPRERTRSRHFKPKAKVKAESDGSDENSDDDDDESSNGNDSDSSDDFVSTKRSRSNHNNKRRRETRKSASPKRKKRGTDELFEKPKHQFNPKLALWPEVDNESLHSLCEAIMAKIVKADSKSFFAIPVAEQYPLDAAEYFKYVTDPMDFRTISTKRVPRYKHITELQEDLIKVFHNCILYNGETSDFFEYAHTLWSNLNTMFEEVCKEEQVMLPRRWKP